MNELDDFRVTMLARHIDAEEAFVKGDPQPRMELWSKRDPVTLFGAIGMSESGWEALSQTFSWIATRFSEVSNFRIDVELVEVSGDLAYVLWFERFDGSIAGRTVEPVTVRVTHTYGARMASGRSFTGTPTTRASIRETRTPARLGPSCADRRRERSSPIRSLTMSSSSSRQRRRAARSRCSRASPHRARGRRCTSTPTRTRSSTSRREQSVSSSATRCETRRPEDSPSSREGFITLGRTPDPSPPASCSSSRLAHLA